MDCFLTSERLGFRCWHEDDLPLAMGLWGDPEVTALMGGPFAPQAVGARLEQEIARMRDFRIQYWPIFLLDGGQFAGCAGLRPRAPFLRSSEDYDPKPRWDHAGRLSFQWKILFTM